MRNDAGKIGRMKQVLPVVLLLVHLQCAAQVVNGDFENPVIGENSSMRLSPGEGELAGWTVSGGDVMVMDFPASSADGSQFLHLLGETSARIEQELVTLAEQPYWVEFDYSESTFLAPFLGMNVFWNGEQVGTYYAEPDAPEDLFWKPAMIPVMGTGSDTLAFESLASGSEGYYLDNVMVTPIPEAKEFGFVAALGLAGLALWRVRRRPSLCRLKGV